MDDVGKGGNGRGNGSCSGNSTQDIQYNLLQSLEAGNRQPSLQVSIRVSGWQSDSRAGSRVMVKANMVRKIK